MFACLRVYFTLPENKSGVLTLPEKYCLTLTI